MGIIDVISGFAVAGATKSIIECFSDWFDAWRCYFESGEYNYDDDTSTDDYCQGFNSGSGEWFDMRITEYKPPFFPGKGGVVFYTTDQAGIEHRHFVLWKQWGESRHLRRSL